MLKRVAALLLALSTASPLAAQGVRTGTLSGTVRAENGDALEGVTITVASPALQGTRSTTSDANGAYILKGLPPGAYTVTFTQGALKVGEQKAQVRLGETTPLDMRVGSATLAEDVKVTAPSDPLSSAQGGVVYRADDVDLLPVGRDPVSTAALAPGATTNTANSDQVSVSGGFGYDNVFLVDGVDISDNVFGSPASLYIEEAMEETQVVTSGVPAEFGRFAGGVVNVVSKKGSNRVSGSFRTDLGNTNWRERTPFEVENDIDLDDRLTKMFAATLGGPAIKDRLWFFLAGQRQTSAFSSVLDRSARPYNGEYEDLRYSLKLTGRLAEGHTLESSYLHDSSTSFGPSFSFSIDPATLNDASYPASLFVTTYNGAFRDNLFGELQYSQKKQGFRDFGGKSPLLRDSPFLTVRQSLAQYNAPYFDSSDPEDRDNRQLTGSLSYYLSTRRLGRHDIKAGFEHFTTRRLGGNSPSSTSVVFGADYKTDALGRPLFDANDRLIPLWRPLASNLTFTLADRGAKLDIRTLSFFLQDRVVLNSRLAFDLGVRFENVRSEATGGIVGVNTSTVVPRLAAVVDPIGDQKWVLSATLAEYAGKYNENQFAQNTTVANPESYRAIYLGPPGEGLDFAPGFDLGNYAIVDGSFPTENIIFDAGLSSPVARELTLALGRRLGITTYVQVLFVERKLRKFVEDFITIDGGFTHIRRPGLDLGEFDNIVYRNSNEPKRHYRALQIEGRHRFLPNWLMDGSYTLQLKNNGNFSGEATNAPALSSGVGDYPEMTVPERNFPEGRLFGYQRHRVRLWNTYRLDLGRAGHVDAGAMWRFDSGLTYSLVATQVPLSAQQEARDPGYKNPPFTQNLFFGERGSQNFLSSHKFDLAVTWTVPVWKSLKPYAKFEAFNLFNNQKLVTWDTTIFADEDGPRDANGLPTQYEEAQGFGEPTGIFDFAGVRSMSLAFGFRF
jgi:hypothetical protein